VLGVHLTYSRHNGADGKGQTLVTELLGSKIERAFDAPFPRCGPILQASATGWAASILDEESDGSNRKSFLLWDRNDSGAASNILQLDGGLAGAEGLVQGVHRSGSLIALETTTFSADVRTTLFDITARTGRPPVQPRGDLPTVFGDGYFYRGTSPTTAISYIPNDGGPAVTSVHGTASSQIVSYAVDIAERTLVWIEVEGAAPTEVSLWVAPIDGDSALKRRVGSYAMPFGDIIAHAGYSTFALESGDGVLVRLRDGASARLPAEPDHTLVRPIWTNSTSSWFVASDILPGQPGYPVMGAVIRMAHPELKAPR